MRTITLAFLLSACDGTKPDTGDTSDTGDGADTSDTGDTAETGDTSDTGDSADTSDTGDTADTSDTGDSADTSDTGVDPVARGREVFLASCVTGCHGTDGDEGPAPDLSEEVPGRSDSRLQEIVLNGTGDMPGVPLADADLTDLLAYLRATWPARR